ncbi:MAG: hypothetical protein ACNA8L_10175 [Luteolibacter sp.]
MIPQTPRITAPEKEIRFTRSGQAVWFWLATLFFAALAVVLFIAAGGRLTEPDRIHPGWSIAPVVLAWFSTRLAMRLTRHAYLILTPIGIEIFPFIRPAAGMRMVAWGEIADAELDAKLRRLTLHFDAAHTSGIHLSLHPVREDLRPLLAKAVLERASASPEPTAQHAAIQRENLAGSSAERSRNGG